MNSPMKTSPRIQIGPMGGGTSSPMNPDRHIVLPNWDIYVNINNSWIWSALSYNLITISLGYAPSNC